MTSLARRLCAGSLVFALAAAPSLLAFAGEPTSPVERFNRASGGEAPAAAECRVQAAGGRRGVAEQDLSSLHAHLAAQIEAEMQPGSPGVQVDESTVLLNGRGYNYAPTRPQW